jgi:anti-sigma regulatory factor (Ser/Thr protein kinase)
MDSSPWPKEGLGDDMSAEGTQDRPCPPSPQPWIAAGSGGGDDYTSCVALPAMASSVATARMHVRRLLGRWRLPALVDDVELVVSEMITNAIKATNVVPARASYPELYDRLEVVCLCVYLRPDVLLVEVWDPRQEPPVPRAALPEDEGGRGLLLVESLTSGWGTRWPKTGGKVVWAAVPLEVRDEA